VTADLPAHFFESLATLGFDPLAGDSLPLEQPKASATPEAKRRKAAAAAKSRRRERRGERRARGSQPKAKRRCTGSRSSIATGPWSTAGRRSTRR
jgi:23S rRNA pseudouridine955/2504/2580 synthase